MVTTAVSDALSKMKIGQPSKTVPEAPPSTAPQGRFSLRRMSPGSSGAGRPPRGGSEAGFFVPDLVKAPVDAVKNLFGGRGKSSLPAPPEAGSETAAAKYFRILREAQDAYESLPEPTSAKVRKRRQGIMHWKNQYKLLEDLSNEFRVTAQTPPTFLFTTSGDTGVPAENSIAFYLALHKAGVPAEMHIFEKGQHGLGLGLGDPALSEWPKLLENWLRARGLLARN
jgi:hypothetical protein